MCIHIRMYTRVCPISFPVSVLSVPSSSFPSSMRTTDENRQLDSGSFTPSNELATCCSLGFSFLFPSFQSYSLSFSSSFPLEVSFLLCPQHGLQALRNGRRYALPAVRPTDTYL